MPQNDLIYWVCKDYDYDTINKSFSFDRFKEKYFTSVGETPLYDRYYSGDTSFYEEYEDTDLDYDSETDNF